MHRWIAVLVAIAAVVVAAPPATAAPPDPPQQCRVDRPDGLWPGDYVDLGSGEWDTNLHHGFNSDFTKQVRPIGHVKALMIFVDFEDAKASDANPNQGGRDWRDPQLLLGLPQAVRRLLQRELQRPLPARRDAQVRQVVPDAQADHGATA